MSNCKVIALTNQKGGVGKTTTAVNLGVSLAKQGKTVLLVDADAQANLTMALGYTKTDNLPITLSDIMQDIIDGKSVDVQESILHTDEGVDLLPSCVELAGVETTLIDTKNRESVLKACISEVKKNYDYVLIDCMPALGMLTINGLAAADSVIIPNQPHYFSIKGLEQLLVFLALMIFSSVFVIWQMKTNEFGGLIDRIEEVFYGTPFKNAYNAKSLILVDLSNDEVFISKRENEQQLPASLAKLFVIKYAVTLADLDSIVSANYEAISLTKSGSSVANIKTKEYYLQNLFAAMLVPSGNDAAYVVADYCGGLLSPQAKNSQERINAFMEHLNDYLQEQGYDDTVLYDPSGFDTEARTTALDLKKVVESLLEYQWFRDIVSKSSYKATLPDERTQMWKNTNAFLDSTSDYYNGNVKGVKTGSLSVDYNLVVLYQQHGKEFLICSLGSKSNSSRYDDVNYIIKTIDESDYLSR